MGVFTQLFVVLATVVTYGLGVILKTVNASPLVFCRIMLSYNAVLIVVQSILMMIDYIP